MLLSQEERIMSTVKIKPSHKSQGEYVLIEESDFDPKIHELLDKPKAEKPVKPVKYKG